MDPGTVARAPPSPILTLGLRLLPAPSSFPMQAMVDLVLADYEHPLGRVLRELTGARLPTVFFTPLGALMPFTDYPPQYVPAL